eukprot:TRINITY_DN10916_c0_g1_i3.p1 TRINITY_DN10916_c0_g1~~TRINITY_DN10916_c0_g1_i3.p1  ORF type:complete len:213 (-),score=25.79 TRINITY_DN10916_c0_g1_i3:10-648(-)
MARVALSAKEVTIKERTTLTEHADGVQIETIASFLGVPKLAQARATVITKLSHRPRGCTVKQCISVHQDNQAHKFVESGMCASLVKAAGRWVLAASKHASTLPACVEVVLEASRPVEPSSPKRTLTKEQRIALERGLMLEMGTKVQENVAAAQFRAQSSRPSRRVGRQAARVAPRRRSVTVNSPAWLARHDSVVRSHQKPIDLMHATLLKVC